MECLQIVWSMYWALWYVLLAGVAGSPGRARLLMLGLLAVWCGAQVAGVWLAVRLVRWMLSGSE